jgi:Zn-dependent peptidase ImmA (M78 family)
MTGRVATGRQALRRALDTRRRANATKFQPICAFDVAERMGVEVIFCPEKTLGGMYNKNSHTILVPTHRPPGRQAFTCAHELGHYLFGHGTRIDEIRELERDRENDPEERLATAYAGHLLMPPWAVSEAFTRRSWNRAQPTPLQVYTVAGQLGVGYETLIHHMLRVLCYISPGRAQVLRKTTPKQIREALLGVDRTRHLVIADRAWTEVAIDLQVGDMAIVPSGTRLEGTSVVVDGRHGFLGTLVRGGAPGISRAESDDGSWSCFIRVSRRDYVGWSTYRHWEDPDVGGLI